MVNDLSRVGIWGNNFLRGRTVRSYCKLVANWTNSQTDLLFSGGIVRKLINMQTKRLQLGDSAVKAIMGATIVVYSDGMMGGPMMWGMGLIWILVVVFLVAGIAAFIKYLRS